MFRLEQVQIQVDPMEEYEAMGATAYYKNRDVNPMVLCPFEGDFKARWIKGFCEARAASSHEMGFMWEFFGGVLTLSNGNKYQVAE